MKKHASLLLSPLFVTAVFMTVFFANGMFPFGSKSISWCDMNQQFIPLLSSFKDILSGEQGAFLNMGFAGGINFLGVFCFFLSSPTSLLVAFIDKADIPLFVNILLVLKLSLTALFATVFFREQYEKLSFTVCSVLGFAYAMSAYGMLYSQNIMWLSVMSLFPLLCLGASRLIKQKRVTLFILSLTLTILVNFYLSIMVLIFLILLFGLFALYRFKDDIAVFTRLALSTLCSLLLSGVILLPCFLQYTASARGESILIGIINDSFFAPIDTTLPLLLFSAFIFAALACFYTRAKFQTLNAKFTFILFIFLCVPVFIEPINRMWQTGSYMAFPTRYGFITLFLGVCLVAEFLQNCDFAVKTKPLVFSLTLLSLITVGIFVFFYIDKNISVLSHYVQTLWGDTESLQGITVLFLICFLAYIAVFKLHINKKLTKAAFCLLFTLLVTVESSAAALIFIAPAKDSFNVANWQSLCAVENSIDDDGFYRVNLPSKLTHANTTGALGFNSLGHYTSLNSQDYMYTAKGMGYSSYWMETGNWGGTVLSDALLGVKYQIKKQGDLYSVEYVNDAFSLILDSKTPIDSEFNDNNRILSLGEVFSKINGTQNPVTQYGFIENNCEFAFVGGDYILSSGNIVYNVAVTDASTLYFDCYNGFTNNLTEPYYDSLAVTVNGKTVSNSYPSQDYNAPLNLGEFKNCTVRIELRIKKALTCSSFGVFGIQNDIIENAVRNANKPKIEINKNTVTAALPDNVNENLLITLPYKKGYTVTLNGEKLDYSRALSGFISVKVNGGGTLKITYAPQGMLSGGLLSLLGIAAAALLIIFNKKIDALPKAVLKIIFVLFMIIFSLTVLAVYIAPTVINLLS